MMDRPPMTRDTHLVLLLVAVILTISAVTLGALLVLAALLYLRAHLATRPDAGPSVAAAVGT
jgi:hypothetical protein